MPWGTREVRSGGTELTNTELTQLLLDATGKDWSTLDLALKTSTLRDHRPVVLVVLVFVSVASGFTIGTSDGAEHDRMGQARDECV